MTAVLVAGALLPATAGRARADGGASTIFGFVYADQSGALPSKVRALGPAAPGHEPAVCGTADVTKTGAGSGFYMLSVASSETHAGCPAPGDDVRFLLMYGAVDPGLAATQVATWSTTPQQVNLTAATDVVAVGGFTGALPPGSGYGLLTWDGADATPIADAVATIPRQVQLVFRVSGGMVRQYVAGAPDFVSSLRELNHGDIVVVLVK